MIGTVCDAGRSGPGAAMIEMTLPRDHLLRRVDRLLDLGELRSALAPHYSPRGRPSVDPELLIRMALIGRIYAITSERRLCEEVRYNLAYRWFCRLPAGVAVPHHSTFSKTDMAASVMPACSDCCSKTPCGAASRPGWSARRMRR